MIYEQFKELIESLQKAHERSHTFYQLGVDLINYNELYQKTNEILFKSVFDEDGLGWIDWYLYERIGFSRDVLTATSENGEPICYDIPSLWKVVKEHLKTK
jgi:hypothetical protein